MSKSLKKVVFVAMLGLSIGTFAGEWSLMPIKGHEPAKWEPAPNWVWHKKNPLVLEGAVWELAYKKDGDAELTGEFRTMTAGKAWNYKFVWRDHSGKSDPQSYYRDNTLIASQLKGPGRGNPSAVFFRPTEPGTYKVELTGTVKVQNKSAGYLLMTAGILTEGRTKIETLQEFRLNSEGGYGKHPADFAFSAEVNLPEDAELAVAVQSVNPGPASSGKAVVNFEKFSVSN